MPHVPDPIPYGITEPHMTLPVRNRALTVAGLALAGLLAGAVPGATAATAEPPPPSRPPPRRPTSR
ncbi:hypothetical protein GCM10020256_73400 [Streptomyces thermocoprophilus]